MKNIFTRYLTIIFLLQSYYIFSQKTDAFYKNFEPAIYVGLNQMVSKAVNRLEIKKPAYEFRAAYSAELFKNWRVKPFLGYSRIVANYTGNMKQDTYRFYFIIPSIIGGFDIQYSVKRFEIGIEFNAKRALKYTVEGYENGKRTFNEDLTDYYTKQFFQSGLCFSYSLGKWKLNLNSIWTIIPVKFINPYGINVNSFPPIRYNEYLIGVGYRF